MSWKLRHSRHTSNFTNCVKHLLEDVTCWRTQVTQYGQYCLKYIHETENEGNLANLFWDFGFLIHARVLMGNTNMTSATLLDFFSHTLPPLSEIYVLIIRKNEGTFWPPLSMDVICVCPLICRSVENEDREVQLVRSGEITKVSGGSGTAWANGLWGFEKGENGENSAADLGRIERLNYLRRTNPARIIGPYLSRGSRRKRRRIRNARDCPCPGRAMRKPGRSS